MTGGRVPPLEPRTAMRPMDVAGRVARLARRIAPPVDGTATPWCDVMIITKPANTRWLTGFTGSNSAVALIDGQLIVATDGRYRTQVEVQLEAAGVSATVTIGRELDELLLAELDGRHGQPGRVGLESHHVSWDRQRSWHDKLVERWSGAVALVPMGPVIDELREIKDDGELDRLRRAAAIGDRALARVMAEFATDGLGSWSERELARRLDTAMFDLGADEPSFPTIVASGPNSALPHARPGDRIVDRGDLLIVDMGARVDGYGSDMTRSFAVGGFTTRSRRLYRAVEQAQADGLASVRSRIEAAAVDRACRSALARHDLEDAFVHGTGHGIGLEIHENPFLSRTSDAMIRSGQAITVEPGVYVPGLGGVRIEDSVIVTDTGHEALTTSPKDPELAV